MSTSIKSRLLGLDILRGIAILLVIFSHNPVFPEFRPFFYWPITYLNRIGWAGVDLFFVLSGYLVGGLLLSEFKKTGSLDVKRFILRRGFKIWPVFYAFLLTFFVARVLLKEPPGELFSQLWPAFVHLQNYFPSTSIVGWFWSLGVEEHFYLFLPLVLALVLRSNKSFPAVKTITSIYFLTLLAFLALRILNVHLSPPSEPPTGEDIYRLVFASHLRFDALLAGVAISALSIFQPTSFERLLDFKWPLLLFGLALVSVPYFSENHNQLFLYPFGLSILTIGFSCCLIFASAFKKTHEESTGRFALAIAHIGTRSYSIYVWHGFFAKPIANRISSQLGLAGADPVTGIFVELIYLLVPVGLGYLSYALIEDPFLSLRNRLIK